MALSQVGLHNSPYAAYGYQKTGKTGNTQDEESLVKNQLLAGGQEEEEKTEEEDKPVGEMSYQEMVDYIRQHSQAIYDKLINGETERKYQIGGSEFTEAEWEKLIARVDEAIEQMMKDQEEEEAKRKKQDSKDSRKEAGSQSVEDNLLDIARDLAEKVVKDRRSVVDTGAKSEEEKNAGRLASAQAGMAGKTEETDEIKDVTGILLGTEKSEGTEEVTSSYDKKVWYVTCFTETGISCKSSEQGIHDAPLWEIKFNSGTDYKKVMNFLNQFGKDENLTFAANENFWKDFLNDEIDADKFFEFYENRDQGVSNLLKEEDGKVSVDLEKLKYFQYTLEKKAGSTPLNQDTIEKLLTEVMREEAKQLEEENQRLKNSSGNVRDAIAYYENLFEYAAPGVADAWYAAKKVSDVDGVPDEKTGMARHISQFTIERLLGNHTSYKTILGTTAESAYDYAKRAVENLGRDLQSGNNTQEIRGLKEKELAFYQEFLKNLDAI